MPAIAEQYKLNPDGAKKSGKPGSEPPVPMKSTENVEIAEESFSAPTADKMSSDEIISYTEIRSGGVQADHICLVKDQKDDFEQLAFPIKSTIPGITHTTNHYFFHFIKPTCIGSIDQEKNCNESNRNWSTCVHLAQKPLPQYSKRLRSETSRKPTSWPPISKALKEIPLKVNDSSFTCYP